MYNKNNFRLMLIIVLILIIFSNISFGLDINVPSAIVIDKDTGRVLFEKNGYEKRAMASLTKIMTSIMLVESCKLDEVISVPDKATYIGGSELGLKKGDTISAYNLLVGMLLPSGNDCAYTTAIHIGGSIENFAKMMTKKAHSIGAINTCFENAHGLDSTNHYSTAYDMALITRYALNNKVITDIISSKNITVSFGNTSKTVKNTNRLLGISNIIGGKTGYTANADRCLMLSAFNNDMNIISIVLGAVTTDLRFNTSKYLIEEVFKIYKLEDISDVMHFYIKIPIEKGKEEYYEEYINIDEYLYPLKENERDNIYIKQDILNYLNGSYKKGDNVGKITVYLDDIIIYSEDIFLDYDIKKRGILDYFKDIFDIVNIQINKLDIY